MVSVAHILVNALADPALGFLAQIGINTGMLSACESPFGGINESGFGKEGSAMGIEEYLITKAINIDISS
jgi:acyl-CoA reductase-like NAD-dependent aldehyde dehydrogenase